LPPGSIDGSGYLARTLSFDVAHFILYFSASFFCFVVSAHTLNLVCLNHLAHHLVISPVCTCPPPPLPFYPLFPLSRFIVLLVYRLYHARLRKKMYALLPQISTSFQFCCLLLHLLDHSFETFLRDMGPKVLKWIQQVVVVSKARLKISA
jgi:hypothetical protein